MQRARRHDRGVAVGAAAASVRTASSPARSPIQARSSSWSQFPESPHARKAKVAAQLASSLGELGAQVEQRVLDGRGRHLRDPCGDPVAEPAVHRAVGRRPSRRRPRRAGPVEPDRAGEPVLGERAFARTPR